MGKFTIEDLRNRKVVLENDSNKKTIKVLNLAFGCKFKKDELPGDKLYVADKNSDDGFIGFCDNDLSDKSYWSLHSDGSRRLPAYLIGYKTTGEYHKCNNLPKQKSSKF